MLSRSNLDRAGFLLFLILAILPMAASLAYAAGYSVGLVGLLSEGFTWQYWARPFQEGNQIFASFVFSLLVAGAATAITLAIALLLVLAARRSLDNGLLAHLSTIPLALPGTVLAFLVLQWFSGSGIAARIAYALGLLQTPAQFPGIVQDQYGVGIIIAQVIVGVPFFALLFAQLWHNQRIRQLMELAQTIGAGRRQRVAWVAIPLLLHGAFPTVILHLVAVIGVYEVPLLLGAQSPQMISVLTMQKYGMFDLQQKPEAFICAILYTLLSLSLIAVAWRRMKHEQSPR
jgi:putative spermidine/putrescine transport system permease protein